MHAESTMGVHYSPPHTSLAAASVVSLCAKLNGPFSDRARPSPFISHCCSLRYSHWPRPSSTSVPHNERTARSERTIANPTRRSSLYQSRSSDCMQTPSTTPVPPTTWTQSRRSTHVRQYPHKHQRQGPAYTTRSQSILQLNEPRRWPTLPMRSETQSIAEPHHYLIQRAEHSSQTAGRPESELMRVHSQ